MARWMVYGKGSNRYGHTNGPLVQELHEFEEEVMPLAAEERASNMYKQAAACIAKQRASADVPSTSSDQAATQQQSEESTETAHSHEGDVKMSDSQ